MKTYKVTITSKYDVADLAIDRAIKDMIYADMKGNKLFWNLFFEYPQHWLYQMEDVVRKHSEIHAMMDLQPEARESYVWNITIKTNVFEGYIN